MKTTSNFKEEAPRCSNCKHSFYAERFGGSPVHYYCNQDGACPYKTQMEWLKEADKAWDPKSKLAKWLGFHGQKDPKPWTTERYVGVCGAGICDDYEPKEKE